MSFLEVRDYTGTKFYKLDAEDYALALAWQKIDCGCAGYASARTQLKPVVIAMLADRTPWQDAVPPNAQIVKFIK